MSHKEWSKLVVNGDRCNHCDIHIAGTANHAIRMGGRHWNWIFQSQPAGIRAQTACQKRTGGLCGDEV